MTWYDVIWYSMIYYIYIYIRPRLLQVRQTKVFTPFSQASLAWMTAVRKAELGHGTHPAKPFLARRNGPFDAMTVVARMAVLLVEFPTSHRRIHPEGHMAPGQGPDRLVSLHSSVTKSQRHPSPAFHVDLVLVMLSHLQMLAGLSNHHLLIRI